MTPVDAGILQMLLRIIIATPCLLPAPREGGRSVTIKYLWRGLGEENGTPWVTLARGKMTFFA